MYEFQVNRLKQQVEKLDAQKEENMKSSRLEIGQNEAGKYIKEIEGIAAKRVK